jgi:hypothetical protein
MEIKEETNSPIAQVEYDIYTALCSDNSLFLFDNSNTVFCDRTGDNFFYRHCDERLPFYGGLKYRCLRQRCKGIIEDYKAKNLYQWSLGKRFQVKNGYRFRSELEAHETQDRGFTLSRVGLSNSGNYGLVHVGSLICGYYVLFHYTENTWQQEASCISYQGCISLKTLMSGDRS